MPWLSVLESMSLRSSPLFLASSEFRQSYTLHNFEAALSLEMIPMLSYWELEKLAWISPTSPSPHPPNRLPFATEMASSVHPRFVQAT